MYIIHIRYVQSWIDKREVQSEKANLTILFERYVPPCLETLRFRFKKITPISETSMVQSLCYLLEVLLTPENTPPDSHKDIYELYFVFAAIWAFGGSMFQDQVQWCIHVHVCIAILISDQSKIIVLTLFIYNVHDSTILCIPSRQYTCSDINGTFCIHVCSLMYNILYIIL